MQTETTPDIQSTERTSGRRNRIIAVVAVAAVLLLAGIWPRIGRRQEALAIANAAEKFVPTVFVRKAKTVPGNSTLMLPGNTEAINVAMIYARANGYVGQRLVDIGSVVKTGQVLAVIESPEIDQELEQARANLVQTKAAVEQAKANLEQARAGVMQAQANVEQAQANEQIAATTDQRWTRLVEKGVLPKQSGDERRSTFLARKAESEAARAALRTAEANVVSRNADLGAAEANVQAQFANVRRFERLQGFERVVAPFDGVVTERKVERGDLVTAGSGSDRNLFAVAQAKTLRIRVNVPQSHAVDLAPGQAAEILVTERPGQTFAGTVARTAQALDAGSRTLLAEVQLDNRAGQLLPGMYAQVKFSLPRSRPVVVIPTDALVANSQGTRVAVVDNSRKIRFVTVVVGRDLGPEVEVITGLNGGESVISNPPDMLADGQEVQVETESQGEKEKKS